MLIDELLPFYLTGIIKVILSQGKKISPKGCLAMLEMILVITTGDATLFSR